MYIHAMNIKSKKFIELANKRVNKTIKDIQLIGNLANKQNYEYTEQQAKKIVKALQQELDDVKQNFASAKVANKKIFLLDESE